MLIQQKMPVVVFEISSSSPEELRAAEELARQNTSLESVITDVSRSRPAGVVQTVERNYRLGDCFSEIEVVKSDSGDHTSFKLVFHVRGDADKFWKDLVAVILRTLRDSGVSVRPC